MSNETVYGFVNCCYHARRPEGDRSFFPTREMRDRAMASLRIRFVADGGSRAAAESGIYQESAKLSDLSDDERSAYDDVCDAVADGCYQG